MKQEMSPQLSTVLNSIDSIQIDGLIEQVKYPTQQGWKPWRYRQGLIDTFTVIIETQDQTPEFIQEITAEFMKVTRQCLQEEEQGATGKGGGGAGFENNPYIVNIP